MSGWATNLWFIPPKYPLICPSFLPSCWGCLSSDRCLFIWIISSLLTILPAFYHWTSPIVYPVIFYLKLFTGSPISIRMKSWFHGMWHLWQVTSWPAFYLSCSLLLSSILQSHSTRSLSHHCAPLQSCPPAFLDHCFHTSTLLSKSFFFKSFQVSFSISLSWTSSSSVVWLQCSHSPRCTPLSTSLPLL